MNYLQLVRQFPSIIGFGVILTCFAGFGQTFFVALFGGEIRETLSLSNGEFGLIYSLATLCSAIAILWVGGLIDRMPLRQYTFWACLLMAGAALLIPASSTILMLFVGLFLIRLTGQGLMGHIAATCITRFFQTSRGKALSLTGLGHPIGEGFLPFLAVTAMQTIGWRETWVLIAVFIVVILLPALLMLLARSESPPESEFTGREADSSLKAPNWSRRQVVRDLPFGLVLPGLLAPAFILTGIFFHQVPLVQSRGWDLKWFAATFAWFSISVIISSILTGHLLDRFGVNRLLPYFLLPLALGLLLLATIESPLVAVAFMVCAGASIAMTPVIATTLLAENYGLKYFGRNRALLTSLMVLSTAIMPFATGYLLDIGANMSQIISGMFGYTTLVAVASAIGGRIYTTRQEKLQQSA